VLSGARRRGCASGESSRLDGISDAGISAALAVYESLAGDDQVFRNGPDTRVCSDRAARYVPSGYWTGAKYSLKISAMKPHKFLAIARIKTVMAEAKLFDASTLDAAD